MSSDTWHDHVDATWHPRGVTHGISHVVHFCEWLTLSHVLKEGNKGKIKIKKIKRKMVVMTSGDYYPNSAILCPYHSGF